jgi:hypothetical protein
LSENRALHVAVEAVNDSESFLAFVRELIADRVDEVKKEKVNPSSPYGPGANGWENGTIETFLEAAVAWAESTNFGERQHPSAQNPWHKFALFLYLGKIYE